MRIGGVAVWRWCVTLVLLLAVAVIIFAGGEDWGWPMSAKYMVGGFGGLSISLAFLR